MNETLSNVPPQDADATTLLSLNIASGNAPPSSTSGLSDPPMADIATSSLSKPPSTDPATSGLSDPPLTDVAPSDGQMIPSTSFPKDGTVNQTHRLSAQTEEILQRIKANGSPGTTPGYEAAKEQMMRDMATSDKFPTANPTSVTKRGGRGARAGRGGQRASLGYDGVEGPPGALASPSARGRGRGRPPGRPRGSRGRGGGRGGKRKREDDDEDDGNSDSSEVYTPAATQTKSGRAVQKPTTFVPPPPPSPTATNKRKRTYRRNPESAVCKVCLRGTSPTNNMIVFCDGCNTPYHRYCHHPPIDQAVIDEVDKEWYCRPCEKERSIPVPEADVSDFVSAEGASLEERKRYFSRLTPGLLVTLLAKATTLHPDLAVFSPTFRSSRATEVAGLQPPTNGHGPPHVALEAQQMNKPRIGASHREAEFIGEEHDMDDLGPEEHPAHYPRPGHGLLRTLPPEQEDLQWLVDDEDQYGVFSHVYQTEAQAGRASNSLK